MKTKEELQQELKNYLSEWGYPRQITNYKFLSDLIFKFFASQNKWISVKEKVPKEGQLVIAFDGVLHHCKYEGDKFYRHTEPSDNDRIIRYYWAYVTHWQPELTPPEK